MLGSARPAEPHPRPVVRSLAVAQPGQQLAVFLV